MSTFEELLASIGIGAATLTIRIGDGHCPRGGKALGSLEVEGGHVAQHVESLSVKLVEFWRQGKSEGTAVRDQLTLASSLTIEPGTRQRFPFDLVIPDDVRLTKLSTFSTVHVQGCRVEAEADIHWAVNPRAMVHVEVVPHYEVQAVQVAMESMGFVRSWAVHIMEPAADVMRTDYAPPDDLRDQLDRATLEIRASGDFVTGSLVLNRREVTTGELLSALVGGNKVDCPLAIPRQQLLTAAGHPHPAGALEYLKQALADVVAMPGDQSKRLLRAACPPGSRGETLLRPAKGAQGQDASGLLRAVPPEEESPKSEG